MSKEDDEIPCKDFIDTIHTVLLYCMTKALEEEYLDEESVEFGYIIPDKFETMADTVIPINKLWEYYSDFSISQRSPLNYALTKDLEDFNKHIKGLYKEELLEMQKMITAELEREDRGF